jgi:hypothetical protein
MWIEIFKSGTHRDSAGRESTYSDETLQQIASKYNDKVSGSDAYQAPLVKGHPKSDDPAFGWVEKLAMRGKYLMAKLKDLAPEIVSDIKQSKFKKISIALYPDMMLRHVGLLGAAAPAVKGLAPVKFEEEEEVYTEYKYEAEMKEEKKTSGDYVDAREYQKLEEVNDQYKKELEDLKKKDRLRDHREYCNSLTNREGRAILNPGQVDLLIDLMEAAHTIDRGEISESSTSGKLKEFVESFGGEALFGEIEGTIPVNMESGFEDKNVSVEKLELHSRALEFQASHPGLSYEEALLQVV